MDQANRGSKPSHICEYCDKVFAVRGSLEEHRRVHTGDGLFSCSLCDYSATRMRNLTVHIRRHLKEKPYKCGEPGCNFSASTSGSVDLHQTVHRQEKGFQCSICSMKFTRKGNLTVHHKTIHLEEKRFHCPVFDCPYKTGQKSGLPQHMKTHEENPEKPFKCELCPYKTTRNSNLKSHMTHIHSEERNLKCPEVGCKFSGKKRYALNRHLESHGEKTLACPHANYGCEYKTNQKRLLNTHVETHNSSSEKRYKCRICHFSCHRSGGLLSHMRTHTKETPFKCKYEGCSYEGKDSCTLNQHVKSVHKKIRPFKCSFCLYSSALKSQMNAHNKRKHRDA